MRIASGGAPATGGRALRCFTIGASAVTLLHVLIGILSDSHDRLPAMVAAIDALRRRGVSTYIHCGDVGSERILDQLAGLDAHFVLGNTDWDRQALLRYAESIGIRGHHPFADLNIDGRRFAVLHGDDQRLQKQLLAGQAYDYLLHGHTHVRDDRHVGRTHLINPGALHRAAQKTVALLETATDQVEFIDLGIDPPTAA